MSRYLTITTIAYITVLSVFITLPASSTNNESFIKLARFTGVKEPYEETKRESDTRDKKTASQEYKNTTEKEDFNYNIQEERIA